MMDLEVGTGRPMDEMVAELCNAPGVPGQEGSVRQIMARLFGPYGTLERDGLGNLCCTVRGSEGPRVMVAAHMDEVGFTVSDVTDGGFLRFLPLGGWWEQVMLAQRVTVHTRRGVLQGVVGSKPPHVLPAEKRKEMVSKTDMFVDVGASGRAEAEDWGIRPGDPIVPVCPFQTLANPRLLMAKAMDDRSGCAVVADVVRQVANRSHPNTVLGVATVQEEVGLRGADVAARHLLPDVAFAVDVGIAGDTPGMDRHEARAVLGGGPMLLVLDSSLVPNPRLRDLVAETAEAEGIPIQWDALAAGGTDAGRMQFAGSGVPSLVIGLPSRYIHSAASIVHQDDLERAATLLTAVIARLDTRTVGTLHT